MVYPILAEITVVLHGAFVLFGVLGGLLTWRWRWVAWLHLPAVVWAAGIQFVGWICPLTPLENWLREKGGGNTYEGGFVEEYITPLIYPAELTRWHHLMLGLLVIAINLAIYWRAWRIWHRR